MGSVRDASTSGSGSDGPGIINTTLVPQRDAPLDILFKVKPSSNCLTRTRGLAVVARVKEYMPSMTKQAIERFLAGPNLARIATVKKDGSPFVVPVWYEWDGKHCYVVAMTTASWVDNITKEPRVAIVIDNDVPPHEKVIIEGEAEIMWEEDWIEIGKRMVKRYMAPGAGAAYLEEIKAQPMATIRVTPKKITSWIIPEP